MMDPDVIDPPDFNQPAAWQECGEYVEKCGGMTHEDGEVNWRAAFGAAPGCCSCPMCGEYYWMWGRRQRCKKCAFEYETDWWPMYSWGTQAAKRWRIGGLWDERMKHPYYRFGVTHPVEHPWERCHTDEWRAEFRAWLEQETNQ